MKSSFLASCVSTLPPPSTPIPYLKLSDQGQMVKPELRGVGGGTSTPCRGLMSSTASQSGAQRVGPLADHEMREPQAAGSKEARQ